MGGNAELWLRPMTGMGRGFFISLRNTVLRYCKVKKPRRMRIYVNGNITGAGGLRRTWKSAGGLFMIS